MCGGGSPPQQKHCWKLWGGGAADEEEVASDWPQRPTALHTRAGRLCVCVCAHVYSVYMCAFWGGHAFLLIERRKWKWFKKEIKKKAGRRPPTAVFFFSSRRRRRGDQKQPKKNHRLKPFCHWNHREMSQSGEEQKRRATKRGRVLARLVTKPVWAGF